MSDLAQVLSPSAYNAYMREQVKLAKARRAAAGTGGAGMPDAQSSLVRFTEHTLPVYQADPVHCLIASYLERVYKGEIKRLIINAPPQIGKSELVSVRFPAWWLGNRPGDSIIISSYGASLAEDKSKQVRQIIDGDEYRAVFLDVHLSEDTRAADMWRLASPNRGGVKAAGVGGAITGFGANLGIIDDPVKDWEEGQSAANLEKIWAWYKGTFRPRLREDAAIVIIMTRWNINDLTGKLLNQGGWELLRLPALAEPDEQRRKNNKFLRQAEDAADPLMRQSGETLAPRRFQRETLEQTKVEVGEVVWAGEYDQVPRAAEGGLFKRDKFNIINDPPTNIVRYVRYFDLALSENESADYTVGVLLGQASDRRLIVLDVRRYQIEWDEAEPKLAEIISTDGSFIRFGIEANFLQKRAVKKLLLRPELHAYTVHGVTSDKDKYTRALPIAARVTEGLVDVLRRGWTDTFIEELCAFPNGGHDDQVDALSGAYAMLDTNPVSVATRRWA